MTIQRMEHVGIVVDDLAAAGLVSDIVTIATTIPRVLIRSLRAPRHPQSAPRQLFEE